MNPKRLVGSLVVVGLAAMLVLNLVWIVRHRGLLGGTRAGQPAPELGLPLLDGGEVRLAELRGRVVLLSFWATWCGPCVHELPDLQRLAGERKDVTFVTVNVEGRDAAPLVRAFRERVGLQLSIALDDGSASAAYRVDTIPRTVVIGKDGKVAASLDGMHSLDDLRRALDEAR